MIFKPSQNVGNCQCLKMLRRLLPTAACLAQARPVRSALLPVEACIVRQARHGGQSKVFAKGQVVRSMSIMSRKRRIQSDNQPAKPSVWGNTRVPENSLSASPNEGEELCDSASSLGSEPSHVSSASSMNRSEPPHIAGASSLGSEPSHDTEDNGPVNEWIILEEELIKEARAHLPLLPMKVPDDEQIQTSGMSAWDLPLKAPPVQPDNPKMLSVSIVGIPNAGKSTLLNQLLQSKLATVSHREQTTRDRILGIMTEGDTQIVVHDTPGIVGVNRAKRLGISKLVATDGIMAAEETDTVIALIDPTMSPPERQLEPLKNIPIKNLIIVINKIDAVKPPSQLLPLVDKLLEHAPVPTQDVLMVSALKSSGIEDLKELLRKKAVPKEWAFPANHSTEMSPLKRISEQIREKYMDIGTEVPYVFKQRTSKITRDSEGKLFIHHQIIVSKNSQKGLLVGKSGSRVYRVTNAVQQELEEIFNCPVSLSIQVEVNKKQHALPAA